VHASRSHCGHATGRGRLVRLPKTRDLSHPFGGRAGGSARNTDPPDLLEARMKPPAFEYVAPSSLDQALALRAQHGSDSAVLAGGQSLIPLLNLRLTFPSVVIALGRVAELAGIRSADGGLSIGAMTRQPQAEHSGLVQTRSPLL